MKKIFPYIFSILCLFCVGVMAGCEDKVVYSLSFPDKYIEVQVGEVIDLNEKVTTKNFSKGDITYVSLDKNVLAISNGKATAVGIGTTLVNATFDTASDYLEVKVVAKTTKMSSPTGLRYDTQSKCIVWDKMPIKVSGEVINVPSYTVSVSYNGEKAIEEDVGEATSYKIEKSGKYEIKVKCNEVVKDGQTIYFASDYSQSLTVSKLASPTNLAFDDETKILSWQADESVKKFQVVVNGLVYNNIEEKQFKIDLYDTKTQGAQNYTIQVNSASDEQNVIFGESEQKTWTRLYAPTINISDGIISWENTQLGAYHYEISTKIGSNTQKYTAKSNELDITNILKAGTYDEISLKVVSDSEQLLDSENESKLKNITKLSPILLTFDENTNTIKALEYEGKTITLEITHNNDVEKIEMQNGEYKWEKVEVGEYSIKAIVMAQNEKEINSDASDVMLITNLAQVDLSGITQSVENGKYYISHEEVDQADTYEYSMIFGGEKTVLTKLSDGSFGEVDTLFNKAGEYTITIQAKMIKSLGKGKYAISSNASVYVIRQENLTLMDNENGQNISWERLDNAKTYSFYVNKDGELYEEEKETTENQYSYSTLSYGYYEIYAKAVGYTDANKMYLDSISYTKQTFSQKYKLESPKVVFDRTTKVVTISYVDLATDYNITLNYNNEDLTLSGEKNDETKSVTVSLETYITDAGTYKISVVAKNTVNNLIKDSDKSEINVIKFSSPNLFTLSKDGILTNTNDIKDVGIKQVEILINDINTQKLDSNLSNFAVKSKIIASTSGIINTNYYLDSEYTTFNIQRLETPQKPVLDDTNLSWNTTSAENFVYELYFQQGDVKYTKRYTSNSIDIMSENLQGIDKTKDFNVSLVYSINGEKQINTNVDNLTVAYDFTSFESKQTTIHKLQSDMDVVVTESEGKVVASWRASEILQVNYELKIKSKDSENFEVIYSGEKTSCDITEYVQEEGVYTLRLKITSQGYVSSEFVDSTVERLTNIESFNVDKKENITISTPNYTKQKQLEKVLVTIDDVEVSNLGKYSETFSVIVKLVAVKNTEGKNYYLDSKTREFRFSRLAKPEKPVVVDNIISWASVEDCSYGIKFSAGDYMEDFTRSENKISASDKLIQNIFETQNTKTIDISVQDKIEAFTATAYNVDSKTFYLTSVFSDSTTITKFDMVQNIQFVATDDVEQHNIKISWEFDDTVLPKQYNISIFKNGEEVISGLVSNEKFIEINDEKLYGEGKYFAQVTVIGIDNYVDSNVASSSEVTRLNKVTKISISQEGVLTYSGVVNATSYSIICKKEDVVYEQIDNIKATSFDLAEKIYEKVFSGEVQVYVRAVGGKGEDALKTLSSEESDVFTFIKAQSSTVRVENDKLIMGANEKDEFDDFATYIVTISANGGVLESFEAKYGETFTFKDFTYKDTGAKLETNIEQNLEIAVKRRIDKENYVLSDTTKTNIIKLADVENFGFKRKGEKVEESTIYLVGDIDQNASKYVLTIYDANNNVVKILNEFEVYSTTFEKALTNELLSIIPASFKMSIYKQGETKEDGAIYINSSKVEISGKRLAMQTSLSAQKGKLVWNKIDNATNYVLRINDNIGTSYEQGTFVKDGEHITNSSLLGKTGSLTVNIKAVGNVTGELLSKDIILDSTYMIEADKQTYVDTNYECTKLAVPENLRVTKGYISLATLTENYVYMAYVNGSQYELENSSLWTSEDTENIYLYSADLYNALKENTTYTLKVQATQSGKDIIYSDLTEDIKIKILTNNTGTIKVEHKVASTEPLKYDYTKIELTWNEDENAKNGYMLFIGGVVFEQSRNYFSPDIAEVGEIPTGGNIYVQVAVMGTSSQDEDGCYYLNSKFNDYQFIGKLNKPTVKLENGVIKWESVKNATGYQVYMDNELFNDTLITTNECDLEGFSDFTEHTLYVRAVSTQPNYIASDLAEYTNGSESAEQKVSKMQSPELFNVKNGALVWNFDSALTISEITTLISKKRITNKATFSISSLDSDTINIKFVNQATNEVYAYDYKLKNFIKLGEALKSQLNNYGLTSLLRDNYLDYDGWPMTRYDYYSVGSTLPSGKYNIYTKQIGDSVSYISSSYGSAKEVYVPYAPSLKLSYQSEKAVLSWNSITIPSEYGIDEVKYTIVAEKWTHLTSSYYERSTEIIDEITGTSVNLTDLIENGKLKTDYNRMYVYVQGDDNKVLNGKPSNVIEIEILKETSAYINDGVLYWNPQDKAKQYELTYQKTSEVEQKKITLTEAYWTCDILESGAEYEIYIRAVADEFETISKVILSGKTCDVGKVGKLISPSAVVNNGIFKWTGIENATEYIVSVYNGEKSNKVNVSNISDENNNLWYETTFGYQGNTKLENLRYTFMSKGDLNKVLSKDSVGYVNSNETSGIYGTVIDTVKDIVVQGGKLIWTITENNHQKVNNYKLIFNKVDDNGAIIDSDYVVTSGYTMYSKDSTKLSYDCTELDSGKYQVTIQAFYLDEYLERMYNYLDQTAYYLMSVKSEICNFEKYEQVEGLDESGGIIPQNIALIDGKFTWEYPKEMEEVNYVYEIVFQNLATGENITKVCEVGEYFGNIVEDITPGGAFNLKVRVVPKDGVDGFISSAYVQFVNINIKEGEQTDDERAKIYQLNGVKASDILLAKDGEDGSLYINWEKYTISALNSSKLSIDAIFKMIYWTDANGTLSDKKTITITESKIDTASELFNFDIEQGFTLYYQIQVLPLGNQSYVPSAFSEVRDIKKPETVKSVDYDSENMCFTWSTEGTSNDQSFKIKDEVLKVDTSGNLVYDASGNPIVVRTYIFSTNDNTTSVYYPIEMGYHRVGVATIIRTSDLEGSLTSSYKTYQDQDTGSEIVKVDMFEIMLKNGEVVYSIGTRDNPYLVSSETQFANIKKRLTKPSYQNVYVLQQNSTSTKVALNSYDYNFNFKQTTDLQNVQILGQTLDNGESVVFGGQYDGDYHSLTFDCNLSQMAGLTFKSISLFTELSSSAKVCNLKIFANFENSLTAGGTISLVCHTNYGKVENVILGKSGDTFTSNNQTMFFSGVCRENKGTIQKVVNYYGVNISSTTQSVGYGGIAYTNSGTITECANYANISITSINMVAGGIVGENTGTVDQSVLKNSKTEINIPNEKTATKINVYFGGIVGRNGTEKVNSGTTQYSYAKTTMTVTRSASNISGTNSDIVYVAGLVGYSVNDNISNSYVYCTIETKSTSTVQIGDVYMFINISVASTKTTTYCYANQSTISAVGGNKFTVTTYTGKLSGDELKTGNASSFESNETNQPALQWESSFSENWQ